MTLGSNWGCFFSSFCLCFAALGQAIGAETEVETRLVYVVLKGEPAAEVAVEPVSPAPGVDTPQQPDLDMFDLGKLETDSSKFGAFKFNFDDEADDFSWDLTRESSESEARAENEEEEQRVSLEQQLRRPLRAQLAAHLSAAARRGRGHG